MNVKIHLKEYHNSGKKYVLTRNTKAKNIQEHNTL